MWKSAATRVKSETRKGSKSADDLMAVFEVSKAKARVLPIKISESSNMRAC
jgi:hypothetical protein